jgi:hypothetical protein
MQKIAQPVTKELVLRVHPSIADIVISQLLCPAQLPDGREPFHYFFLMETSGCAVIQGDRQSALQKAAQDGLKKLGLQLERRKAPVEMLVLITWKRHRVRIDRERLSISVSEADLFFFGVMSGADSEGWRSAFRTDVDHDSEVMPISVPN